MEDLLRVGVIASTHGIRGEVKVFPTTDDVKRFQKLKQILLDTGKEQILLEVENCKFFKQFAILKFKGIDNINDIERYKGKSLFVTRDLAVPLEEDEFFVADMIGMRVELMDHTAFGILTDVLSTGANDVYVVTTNDKKEVLIPAIKQCVKSINLDENCMRIELLPGLIDEPETGK